MDDNNPLKKIWDTPEGKTGKWILYALLFVGVVGLLWMGPMLSALVGSLFALVGKTIALAIVSALAAAAVYMAFDPKVRHIISLQYLKGINAIRHAIIRENPIGAIEAAIELLRDKENSFKERKTTIDGRAVELQNQIETNNNEIRKCLELATLAKKAGKEQDALRLAKRANVFLTTNQKLKGLLLQVKVRQAILQKVFEAAKYSRLELEDRVEGMKQEWQMAKDTTAALKDADAAIDPNSMERQTINDSIKEIEQVSAQATARFQNFVTDSQDILARVEVETSLDEQKARDLLDGWTNRNADIFAQLTTKVDDATSPKIDLNVGEQPVGKDGQSAEDMINQMLQQQKVQS